VVRVFVLLERLQEAGKGQFLTLDVSSQVLGTLLAILAPRR
jgi:hypothetical protein